ncbi:MAG: YwiC-like family protein [Gemmatimonadetes bacterium]|nr:YwiC-like family protein [Gemmatimonadota bacterium]
MPHEPRLRPREHGAYAMLLFPVVSGLAMGGLSWAGIAFAGLAVTGFLAHESILVVRGARGERIRSAQATQARSRLLSLSAVAVAASGTFAVTAPAAAWRAALPSGFLAVVVGALLLARKTKSLAGELLVAATFSSVHPVLAAAGGADARVTYLPAAAWVVCFTLATLCVHALKRRFKGRGPGRWAVVVAPLLAGIGVVLGVGGVVLRHHPLGAVAASVLPKAAAVLLLSALPANPRHLKRVGWTFVAADALTLGVLVWGLG